jgi:hypothetical protein
VAAAVAEAQMHAAPVSLRAEREALAERRYNLPVQSRICTFVSVIRLRAGFGPGSLAPERQPSDVEASGGFRFSGASGSPSAAMLWLLVYALDLKKSKCNVMYCHA